MAEFPTITICPDYSVAYKKEILKAHNAKASDVRKYRFPETKNITTFEFYLSATYDLEELLAELTIEASNGIEGSNFTTLVFNSPQSRNPDFGKSASKKILDLNPKDWKSQHYLIFGRCFSYDMPQWLKNLMVKILF